MRAIVLVSGGMDSLYTAAIAARECDELYFLHFNYGQHTQTREEQSFYQIASHYQAKEAKVVDYRWLAEIGGSALTDKGVKEKLNEQKIPNTYVPFRNATMLCAAVAWAEVLGAERIYIGAMDEDSSGYPDCRAAFFQAMNQVVQLGTCAGNIAIHTPVLHLSKADIVRKGISEGIPFELSWSCYYAEDKACGTCPSCKLRLKAFQEAGISDPIPYKELS